MLIRPKLSQTEVIGYCKTNVLSCSAVCKQHDAFENCAVE